MPPELSARPVSHPNPDLVVEYDEKPNWNLPEHRRRAYHSFAATVRYSSSFRAARVLELRTRANPLIATRPDVASMTALPTFSALVVAQGQHVLFERYAADFGPDRPHALMSVTKPMMNLIVGLLVESGHIDLDATVETYIPEIGSGYRGATVQQVLDMNVRNEYTEDYKNPKTLWYPHESIMGWRLPREEPESSIRPFLTTIESDDIVNPTGELLYKNTNTDLLGWIAERVSGRPLAGFYADIADAAGIAHALIMSTDRLGVPSANGGGAMTARDLARLGLLFVRRGEGVDGRRVGSASLIEASREGGIPFLGTHYCNQLMTDGRWVGHGGSAGQLLVADLESGVVCAYFSVSEEKDGDPGAHYLDVIASLAEIAREY